MYKSKYTYVTSQGHMPEPTVFSGSSGRLGKSGQGAFEVVYHQLPRKTQTVEAPIQGHLKRFSHHRVALCATRPTPFSRPFSLRGVTTEYQFCNSRLHGDNTPCRLQNKTMNTQQAYHTTHNQKQSVSGDRATL